MTFNPCEKTCLRADKLFRDFFKTNAPFVCHYTYPEAMMNILITEKIWATDIKFLNDKQEGIYVFELLRKYLQDYDNLYSKDFCKIFRNSLEELIDSGFESVLGGYTMVNVHNYTVSFSTKKDNLSMWNYYTKNPNIIGYNIAFRKRNLINALNKKGIIEGKVVYKIKDTKEFLEKIIKLFYKAYKKEIETYGTDANTAGWVVYEMIKLLVKYRLFFKHPAFADEREYRLVLDTEETPKIRVNNGILVPYLELKFPKNSVGGIVVSPAQDTQDTINGLKTFINVYNYDNVNCVKSNIPLRT